MSRTPPTTTFSVEPPPRRRVDGDVIGDQLLAAVDLLDRWALLETGERERLRWRVLLRWPEARLT